MEQIKINRVGKHCYWKKNIFNQLFTVELRLHCVLLQYFNIFQWNGFIFVWKFNWNLVSYATINIIRFMGLKLLIKYIIQHFSTRAEPCKVSRESWNDKKNQLAWSPIVWQQFSTIYDLYSALTSFSAKISSQQIKQDLRPLSSTAVLVIWG